MENLIEKLTQELNYFSSAFSEETRRLIKLQNDATTQEIITVILRCVALLTVLWTILKTSTILFRKREKKLLPKSVPKNEEKAVINSPISDPIANIRIDEPSSSASLDTKSSDASSTIVKALSFEKAVNTTFDFEDFCFRMLKEGYNLNRMKDNVVKLRKIYFNVNLDVCLSKSVEKGAPKAYIRIPLQDLKDCLRCDGAGRSVFLLEFKSKTYQFSALTTVDTFDLVKGFTYIISKMKTDREYILKARQTLQQILKTRNNHNGNSTHHGNHSDDDISVSTLPH